MCKLEIQIGKLTLANPILTASGTFGYGEEFSNFIDLNRLGGIVTKAVTYEPRIGNPSPRIAETPCGMLNSIGLTNSGVKKFIEEKLPFLNSLKTSVIVNVAGKTIDEFIGCHWRIRCDEQGMLLFFASLAGRVSFDQVACD